MSESDLVSVMVPKQYLSKVYGFIASLESGGPQAEPMPADAATNGEFDDWTSSRLQRMVRESPPAMRDMLREIASRSEDWVTSHDLAKAIKSKPNADWNTVAGTMGAFGRRLKSRYGIETKPYEQRRDHEARCKVFRMKKDVADQILHALESSK
jgi:hypothetical protein